MKKQKVKYEAPSLTVVTVELEQGIAASSASITPGGGAANPNSPLVTTWDTETEPTDVNF